MFLSYENGLKRELTNDEVVDCLKDQSIGHMKIKECFDLCSLVEFAKYKANNDDFEKILVEAQGVIGK